MLLLNLVALFAVAAFLAGTSLGMLALHYAGLALSVCGFPMTYLMVSAAVSAFLAAEATVISRKSDKGTKELDIRPMVRDITVTGPRTFRFILQESGGKSAKPHELGQALFGMSPEAARALKVKRTALN